MHHNTFPLACICVLAVLSPAPAAAAADLATVRADSPDLAATARSVAVGASLRVAAVPLEADGATRDLVLERFQVFTGDAKVVIHGVDGVITEPAPANVYLRGRIDGSPRSTAVLTVRAQGGIRGIVNDGGRYWIVEGFENVKAGGAPLVAREIDVERELAAETFSFRCETDALTPPLEMLRETFERPAAARS